MRSGREHRPWWSTPPSAAWYEVTPLPRQVRSGQIVDGSVLLGEGHRPWWSTPLSPGHQRGTQRKGASALVVDASFPAPLEVTPLRRQVRRRQIVGRSVLWRREHRPWWSTLPTQPRPSTECRVLWARKARTGCHEYDANRCSCVRRSGEGESPPPVSLGCWQLGGPGAKARSARTGCHEYDANRCSCVRKVRRSESRGRVASSNVPRRVGS